MKQTLYHRLLAFKQLAAQLAAKQNHHRLNPLGVELGLSAPVPTVDGEGNAAEHYYEHLLDLSEKLFDNDIDASTFEEQLRYMVGIRAYPLFTIDKLIGTAIKHVRSNSPCHLIRAQLLTWLVSRFTRSIPTDGVKTSLPSWRKIARETARRRVSRSRIAWKWSRS